MPGSTGAWFNLTETIKARPDRRLAALARLFLSLGNTVLGGPGAVRDFLRHRWRQKKEEKANLRVVSL